MVKQKTQIILVSLFILFTLVSCGKEVKTNILESTENIKINKLEKNEEIKKEEIKNEEIKKNALNITKSSTQDLLISFYTDSGEKKLKEKINKLEKKGTNESKQKASFIRSFIGDYKGALESRDKNCLDKKDTEFCKKINLNLKLEESKDSKGKILHNLQFSIDGKSLDIQDLKKENNLNIYNNFIHRLKISKKGYTDFYERIDLKNYNNSRDIINPVLIKAYSKKIIDNAVDFETKTKNFEFKIKSNTFTYKDGRKIDGEVIVYFFDINRENQDNNLFNLDIFDENGTFIGNGMKTYGMPLVKAYIGDKELKINKEIIGKTKIQYIEKEMDLKGVPKGKFLEREELLKYKLPPFWRLNQETGVWNSSKLKILNEKGNCEFKLK